MLCCSAAFSETIFTLHPIGGNKVRCDFISVADKKIFCRDRVSTTIFPVKGVKKIVVLKNNKIQELADISTMNNQKLEKTVNIINNEKSKIASEKNMRVSQHKLEMQRRRYNAKRNKAVGEAWKKKKKRECRAMCHSGGCYERCLKKYGVW